MTGGPIIATGMGAMANGLLGCIENYQASTFIIGAVIGAMIGLTMAL